ncbi:MAG: MarR family transcriptional regulator [Thermofilum sp.]|nr:MarR family transcriptional regulator [Thermofilum sp.]
MSDEGAKRIEEEAKRIAAQLMREGRIYEIALLAYLYHFPEGALLADLREVVGRGKITSYHRTLSYVMRLKEMGLVVEERIKRFRLYKLTDKGREVAKIFAEMMGPIEA